MKYAVLVSALLEVETDEGPERAAEMAGSAAVEDNLNFELKVMTWPGDSESPVLFTGDTNTTVY